MDNYWAADLMEWKVVGVRMHCSKGQGGWGWSSNGVTFPQDDLYLYFGYYSI